MLFKFASYFLGTNNTEQTDPPAGSAPTDGSTPKSSDSALHTCENGESISQFASGEKQAEPELIYDEHFVQTDDRPERLEDSLNEDDEQWIYITPRPSSTNESNNKVESMKSSESVVSQEQASEQPSQSESGETFNFYEYFNTNRATVPRSKMEESWLIHPPPCFQMDNTFAIEQDPFENLYIEQPALSVINARRAAASVNNKENTAPAPTRKPRIAETKRRVNTRKSGKKAIDKNNAAQSAARDSSFTSPLAYLAFTGYANNNPSNTTSMEVSAASSKMTSKHGFRRENFSTRPFTIHRKLC